MASHLKSGPLPFSTLLVPGQSGTHPLTPTPAGALQFRVLYSVRPVCKFPLGPASPAPRLLAPWSRPKTGAAGLHADWLVPGVAGLGSSGSLQLSPDSVASSLRHREEEQHQQQ